MARPASVLDPVVDVETPEQVVVSHTLAGPGARGAALLVDLAVTVGAYVLVAWLAGAVVRNLGLGRSRLVDEWGVALFLAGQFILQWGYHVVCEATFDGQTPGKRLLRLRVVRLGGGGIDLGASAARNLLRVVDMQPGLVYAVGILSSVVTRNNQRLGDLVAGTIVVRERPLALRIPPAPVAAPEGEPVPALAAPRLDDATFALLDTFVARAAGYAPDARARIAGALAAKCALPAGARDAEAALRELHAREVAARAVVVPVRSDAGGRREEWALVAEGRERWDAFAAQLERVRRTGLARLDEEAVTRFVEDYRAVAADLARLRTADRGRGGDAVYALSRLVAAGHNLIYRRPTRTLARAWRFVALDVPAEVRRSWRPILAAALLLFVPAIVTGVAVASRPALGERILGPGMVARAEGGKLRANTGADYLGDTEIGGPLMATGITTNNVRVTYVAFAGGILFGVGTVLALVFNGIAALGAGVGYYVSQGIGPQILGFVAAHGVLELAAICIGGGGGLLLATALLLPGDRTRREALVEYGARALHLVACATLFLLVAGTIEGNISPSAMPDSGKYGVAVLTFVAMVWYLRAGRGASDPDAPTARPAP